MTRSLCFDHTHVKDTFHVDAYFQELNVPPRDLIVWSTYWYSVWSHRRTRVWKGYLQIDLAPIRDATARGHLKALMSPGGS